MDRLNSEGIDRSQLKYALTQERMVKEARRVNRCLLCAGPGVNEAGVCDGCSALLSGEEARLVELWMAGVKP
ncbi:MAG: hypothetical protein MUC92_07360 [Fimbriimonadaceae bacterium]|jgi:hypothetical protein|nr:hypothetical protein [Fimbriimonadaceae bacterium]